MPPIIIANGTFPQVGIDSNGRAHAVWLNITNNQVFTSRFLPNTMAWSSPIQLSTGGINAAPQVAVNASGNALAVWIQSSPQTILAATFNASTGVWSAPVALVTGVVSFPQVTLDNANNGIVMWTGGGFGIEALTVTVP